DPFAETVLTERARIADALQTRFIPSDHRQNGLFEEYTILLMKDAGPSPDQWVADNAHALATFIRSQREVLGEAEIREILASRSRYSAQDLTVVDWEGAVVIAPNDDF